MDGKTATASAKDWVESKRSEPTPASSTGVEPHMLGIPKIDDEILGGKYKIERVIGVGGMGVVVAALHKQLGQRVAIKFLSASMQTPELVDRFLREGQAAVRIKSEHIAPVLDVGVLESGTPYLMMEYLHGADLGEYLADRGALPVEEAVDFVLQACEALAVAHAAGIVHRDLKPSNLFMTQRSDGSPLIKVLDFGISKITEQANLPNPRTTLTRPGMMLGSPRYMSPEQLRNASSVDHRADVWAIGIVLHELVAGTPPYDADTFAELCSMIAHAPPTPLTQVAPHAPAALEEIIGRCVAKEPKERFQSVAELAVALAPITPEESRSIASRIGKILGHIPGKTPAGSYRATKVSAGTPLPDGTTPQPHDRTMPLAAAASSKPPISSPSPSSPLASTDARPVVSAAPHPAGGAISTSSPSALAVSAARQVPPNKSRLGLIAGGVALVAAAILVVTMMRRSPAPVTAAPPSPPPSAMILPAAASASTPVAVAAPSPSDTAPAAPSTSVSPVPTGKPTVSPPTHPHLPIVPPPRASAPAAVSAPPPNPAPAPPSEADMLNRRR